MIGGTNDYYDQFIEASNDRTAISRDQIYSRYQNKFTAAYAFSVFTHVEKLDFSSLLTLVEKLLVPGGEFLFTAFLLTPYSRKAITNEMCLFPFGKQGYENNNQVFIGNGTHRLGFIEFDLSLLETMIFEAGLIITHIEHGAWTGSEFSSSLQDAIVCRKPKIRTKKVELVPIVSW